MGRYLTTQEAADLLGVDERTVYYYVRDREPRPPKHKGTDFPEPRRFGRTMMHDEEELLAWRAAHPARAKRRAADEERPAGSNESPGSSA
ncbi:helix-turn-helix domain-containing protein [Streptomyces sp. NPDC006610]|uniref:helix-turn-helix domain-containing protein n=1 Tax=Streptomyces sp. NPDC006610 TaxID=3154584 RepID=UPI0033B2BA44